MDFRQNIRVALALLGSAFVGGIVCGIKHAHEEEYSDTGFDALHAAPIFLPLFIQTSFHTLGKRIAATIFPPQ